MAVRWKDKALIGTLADDDNIPVTDTSDTDTDKRATVAKIGEYIGGYSVTLTNKTFDLTNNTLTGTAAQFDAACSDDTFVFTSEVGSVVQAWDADLDTLAGLSSADGNFIVGSASGWVVESGGMVRTSLGLGTGDSPQFSTVELGHASDTTLSRDAAGEVAVEGSRLAKREPDINAQTGTSYTGVLADAGKVVTMDNGSANTFTIPANSSVAYPTSTIINVIQKGAGTTTISGDTGVTVNGVSAGSADVGNQYGAVALIKIATDTWIASGAIGTVA